jgi:hypothetical protein
MTQPEDREIDRLARLRAAREIERAEDEARIAREIETHERIIASLAADSKTDQDAESGQGV